MAESSYQRCQGPSWERDIQATLTSTVQQDMQIIVLSNTTGLRVRWAPATFKD